MRVLSRVKRALRMGRVPARALAVQWTRRNPEDRLARVMPSPFLPAAVALSAAIEARAAETGRRGAMPLWEGYGLRALAERATRKPDDVRTTAEHGNAYAFLVQQLRPEVVVEFGAAFGVSGMYFLAGIESNGFGQLYSFEPNTAWAEVARQNFQATSPRFTLTNGTFEDHADAVLPATPIGLAFIDAIHTGEFVRAQLEIVLRHSRPGTVILFDDLNFSDDMSSTWRELAEDRRFVNTLTLGARVGVVEVA